MKQNHKLEFTEDAIKMWKMILKHVEDGNPQRALHKVKEKVFFDTEFYGKYISDCSYCHLARMEAEIHYRNRLDCGNASAKRHKCDFCIGVHEGIFPDTLKHVPCVFSFIDDSKTNHYKNVLDTMRDSNGDIELNANAIKLMIKDFEKVHKNVLKTIQ